MSFSELTPASPLVLIGAGKMGGALLAGWLSGGLDPKAVIVVDPGPPPETAAMLAKYGVAHGTTPPENIQARVLLLAVKPQMMGAALPAVQKLVGPGTVSVSIAAGTPISTLEAALGGAIVRVMPNTPAQVGRGVSGAHGNAAVTEADRALVTALLEAVGLVGWVDSEELIDTVTAVSGSGPAYVFLLAEYLAAAGVAAGLPADIAEQFARQTVTGAGELLHQSDLSAETLRRNVTSPKGTTAEALAILMADDGLLPLLTRAVAAAKRRAEELAT
jgi:pyrroline-5-carboxylate reductase